MWQYITRRLLLAIPTIILATLIVFITIRLIPGSILTLMEQQYSYIQNINMDVIKHNLGLDVPVYVQYFRWVGNIILHGDFGKSMWTTTSVISEISAAWPVTLELGILAIIISQLIALPIGIFSALRQDTWGDYLARSFAILFIAIPGFWIATLVMVFPSIWWGWTPSIVYIPFVKDPIGSLGMFILPAVVLGLNGSGSTMRMTRTMMLEVMRQDYIRTAWAKGLRERVVVTRHTLKNALIPVVTIIGMQLPSVIGGAVIIETIFGLPGMGRLIVTSTTQRDYTMVSGVMLFFAVGLVLINIIVDLTYGILDPRVHYK
jgi:peptide/nickel transport system permease protein